METSLGDIENRLRDLMTRDNRRPGRGQTQETFDQLVLGLATYLHGFDRTYLYKIAKRDEQIPWTTRALCNQRIAQSRNLEPRNNIHCKMGKELVIHNGEDRNPEIARIFEEIPQIAFEWISRKGKDIQELIALNNFV